MSKLSFRARALDASKPLPVFRCEDLPDLHEYASINRAVPQMPTGMEKEEESVMLRFFSLYFYRLYPPSTRSLLCASLHKMAAMFLPDGNGDGAHTSPLVIPHSGWLVGLIRISL
ncbi:enhancer of polycomb homolog 1 S homeolog [Xenopus laevis]|uniref:Enhancer of polycomb homolog 1 S homeolog n=1 Tax=Xenopus laevis TaxID=8355 RepID=Q640H8_XENLA|nr:enhancer of polycomb homolog 1 S homeolog [Xenopus laevis]AAH82647.1 LOC494670 protein [Xenopus laevis]